MKAPLRSVPTDMMGGFSGVNASEYLRESCKVSHVREKTLVISVTVGTKLPDNQYFSE